MKLPPFLSGRRPSSALPASADKAAFVKSMFDEISPRYDLVNRIMTMRMDLAWREYAAKHLALSSSSKVLDVACGTGDFVRLLRSMGHSCVGVDFSYGMLSSSDQQGLVQADATALPFGDESFDGLTCGFALRNFVSLDVVFGEMARVLRSGAKIALVEVSRPTSPVVRQAHSLYFDHVVPAVGSFLSSSRAYNYLPQSTAYLPSEGELRAKLQAAGFTSIEVKYFLFGSAQVISTTKR